MTDKQIKIDGMDCRYWLRPNPTDCRKCSLRGQDDNCDEIKDCFVKELLGKLAHKEQECEELKEKVKELRQGWINCDNKRNLQEANSEFRQRVINRYKQALDEIEKQAKAMNNECFYDDICDCNNCDMKNGCSYYRKSKILNIINKVKE